MEFDVEMSTRAGRYQPIACLRGRKETGQPLAGLLGLLAPSEGHWQRARPVAPAGSRQEGFAPGVPSSAFQSRRDQTGAGIRTWGIPGPAVLHDSLKANKEAM